MTQEEKKLLAKDLGARLPYGVNGLITIHITMSEDITPNRVIDGKLYDRFVNLQDSWYHNIPSIKPYLRPMSSMTEDEERELNSILPCGMSFSIDCHEELIIYTDSESDGDHYFSCFVEVQDYLNAHHFDYRGLIGKGLALEAPDGMYIKEDKQ